MNEKEFDRDEQSMDLMSGEFSTDHAKNNKKTIVRLLKDLMKQKGKIFVIFLSIIGAAICSVIAPTLIGDAINEIFNGVQASVQTRVPFEVNFSTMGQIFTAIFLVYALNTLLTYIQQYLMSGVSQNLVLGMRKSISDKLNRLPLRYYDTHKKGDILSRVTSDLEKVADTLQEGLTQAISSVVTLLGAFIMMMRISVSLTFISLGSIIASLVLAALISKRTHAYYVANQKALGELNANIEEAFTGNAVIKSFNLEDSMVEINGQLNENLRQTSTRAQFSTYMINPLIRFVGQLGYVAIAVRGALSVIAGTLSVGEIQAVFQYVNQISEPVVQFSYTMNSLQGAIAAAERVYEIQDEVEETADKKNSLLLPEAKGTVKFDHVYFGYQEDTPLMEDVNIQVKAGSTVAIVGPTGAGKTTLINLIMRFYEIQSGSICIDGVDIREMSREELRSLLGLVLQDTWLFNGTVSENIAFGRTDATQEEIVQAAKAARIDHFIRTLPQGYDTVLDDEQVVMSVGQKQLLTIARAILADPTILILDEATSSVDTRTEVEIQRAMNQLMEGRTSFVIAHRLSTIRNADQILVMNHGTIVEQGTHQELLAKNGMYAGLYNSQYTKQAS